METILTKIVIFFSNHRFVSPKLIYSSKIIYDPDKILFNHFAIILLVCWGGEVPWKEVQKKHLIAENIFKSHQVSSILGVTYLHRTKTRNLEHLDLWSLYLL